MATVQLNLVLEADTVVIFNGPGTAIALYPGAGRPGAAFMFCSSASADPDDADAVAQLMTASYGGAGWRAPELLADHLEAPDRYFDTVSRVRVRTWSNGLVTLLGDAASCISLFGEGSSSAIQGAATLAESLGSTADVTAVLSRYETIHRRAAARGQRAAPIVARLLIPRSQTGITLRNAALRLAGRWRPGARHPAGNEIHL